jgi:hypothetical protein
MLLNALEYSQAEGRPAGAAQFERWKAEIPGRGRPSRIASDRLTYASELYDRYASYVDFIVKSGGSPPDPEVYFNAEDLKIYKDFVNDTPPGAHPEAVPGAVKPRKFRRAKQRLPKRTKGWWLEDRKK